jgi:2-keto-4-pentenoate hydratase/2-oxohepta-3-ene-1,7-dioic acid hydratase in catechol pathway
VFGYTLVADFLARSASGDPMPSAEGVALSIGPCVATGEELDPQTSFVTVRIDGEQLTKANLNGTATGLLGDVARASRTERLSPGDAFAASPFPARGAELRVWPGAEVELEAEGIGVLRNPVARA